MVSVHPRPFIESKEKEITTSLICVMTREDPCYTSIWLPKDFH